MRNGGNAPFIWVATGFFGHGCCVTSIEGNTRAGALGKERTAGRKLGIGEAFGIVKEVGAALTPEQKAEQALENQRRKQLENASREQRRRDQALLDTYSMPEDIDLAQRKAEADVNLAILATITRIDQARTKRKKFEDEAEFYKKKALPPDLERDLRALDHEIKLQQDLLDIKKREFDVIKAKYDTDRKRYFELTRRPLAPTAPAPSR